MSTITKPEVVASVAFPRTVRQRLELFLENQQSYCTDSKRHHLEMFKSEVLSVMARDGMTDEQLLLALELNNYLRQVDQHKYQFTIVSYTLGVPYA